MSVGIVKSFFRLKAFAFGFHLAQALGCFFFDSLKTVIGGDFFFPAFFRNSLYSFDEGCCPIIKGNSRWSRRRQERDLFGGFALRTLRKETHCTFVSVGY